MGKWEEDEERGSPFPAEQNAGAKCDWVGSICRPRCALAVLLGASVLLSAVFWLPPFLKHGDRGPGDVVSGARYGANILASFVLQRSVQEMSVNNQKLQHDIFDEIRIPNSSVILIAVEPLHGLNWTVVVFGVLPYPPSSVMPSTSLNILRSHFVSMVTQKSVFHLTPSLFGNSSFFQALEFPGGITIIPPQDVFHPQKMQILLNFTLNFSIYKVQNKTCDLRNQMGSALRLASEEYLYFRLTNMLGSTIAPPVIVQAAIVPIVGKHPQSWKKQLAQRIASSRASNLGLNHTVFGKVKQISLSSFLQDSVNGGNKNDTSSSPSSAPRPSPQQHYYPPKNPWIPPAPQYSSQPPGCQHGFLEGPKGRF